MDKRCIVFYDSGSGGLNLFERTRKVFPNENYIYFADEKNLPFGDKTEEELNVVFDKAIETINSFCPKLLVVACNTMSCCAGNRLGELPYKAIGVYPFLPENEKTNKSSGSGRKNTKGLLLTTPATAKTDYIKRLVNGRDDVLLMPQKTLASDVERWRRGGKKPDISLNFRDLNFIPEFISLGCTHYGFLKNDIKKLFPKTKILSGEINAFKEIRLFLTTFATDDRNGTVYFIKSQ